MNNSSFFYAFLPLLLMFYDCNAQLQLIIPKHNLKCVVVKNPDNYVCDNAYKFDSSINVTTAEAVWNIWIGKMVDMMSLTRECTIDIWKFDSLEVMTVMWFGSMVTANVSSTRCALDICKFDSQIETMAAMQIDNVRSSTDLNAINGDYLKNNNKLSKAGRKNDKCHKWTGLDYANSVIKVSPCKNDANAVITGQKLSANYDNNVCLDKDGTHSVPAGETKIIRERALVDRERKKSEKYNGHTEINYRKIIPEHKLRGTLVGRLTMDAGRTSWTRKGRMDSIGKKLISRLYQKCGNGNENNGVEHLSDVIKHSKVLRKNKIVRKIRKMRAKTPEVMCANVVFIHQNHLNNITSESGNGSWEIKQYVNDKNHSKLEKRLWKDRKDNIEISYSMDNGGKLTSDEKTNDKLQKYIHRIPIVTPSGAETNVCTRMQIQSANKSNKQSWMFLQLNKLPTLNPDANNQLKLAAFMITDGVSRKSDRSVIKNFEECTRLKYQAGQVGSSGQNFPLHHHRNYIKTTSVVFECVVNEVVNHPADYILSVCDDNCQLTSVNNNTKELDMVIKKFEQLPYIIYSTSMPEIRKLSAQIERLHRDMRMLNSSKTSKNRVSLKSFIRKLKSFKQRGEDKAKLRGVRTKDTVQVIKNVQKQKVQIDLTDQHAEIAGEVPLKRGKFAKADREGKLFMEISLKKDKSNFNTMMERKNITKFISNAKRNWQNLENIDEDNYDHKKDGYSTKEQKLAQEFDEKVSHNCTESSYFFAKQTNPSCQKVNFRNCLYVATGNADIVVIKCSRSNETARNKALLKTLRKRNKSLLNALPDNDMWRVRVLYIDDGHQRVADQKPKRVETNYSNRAHTIASNNTILLDFRDFGEFGGKPTCIKTNDTESYAENLFGYSAKRDEHHVGNNFKINRQMSHWMGLSKQKVYGGYENQITAIGNHAKGNLTVAYVCELMKSDNIQSAYNKSTKRYAIQLQFDIDKAINMLPKYWQCRGRQNPRQQEQLKQAAFTKNAIKMASFPKKDRLVTKTQTNSLRSNNQLREKIHRDEYVHSCVNFSSTDVNRPLRLRTRRKKTVTNDRKLLFHEDNNDYRKKGKKPSVKRESFINFIERIHNVDEINTSNQNQSRKWRYDTKDKSEKIIEEHRKHNKMFKYIAFDVLKVEKQETLANTSRTNEVKRIWADEYDKHASIRMAAITNRRDYRKKWRGIGNMNEEWRKTESNAILGSVFSVVQRAVSKKLNDISKISHCQKKVYEGHEKQPKNRRTNLQLKVNGRDCEYEVNSFETKVLTDIGPTQEWKLRIKPEVKQAEANSHRLHESEPSERAPVDDQHEKQKYNRQTKSQTQSANFQSSRWETVGILSKTNARLDYNREFNYSNVIISSNDFNYDSKTTRSINNNYSQINEMVASNAAKIDNCTAKLPQIARKMTRVTQMTRTHHRHNGINHNVRVYRAHKVVNKNGTRGARNCEKCEDVGDVLQMRLDRVANGLTLINQRYRGESASGPTLTAKRARTGIEQHGDNELVEFKLWRFDDNGRTGGDVQINLADCTFCSYKNISYIERNTIKGDDEAGNKSGSGLLLSKDHDKTNLTREGQQKLTTTKFADNLLSHVIDGMSKAKNGTNKEFNEEDSVIPIESIIVESSQYVDSNLVDYRYIGRKLMSFEENEEEDEESMNERINQQIFQVENVNSEKDNSRSVDVYKRRQISSEVTEKEVNEINSENNPEVVQKHKHIANVDPLSSESYSSKYDQLNQEIYLGRKLMSFDDEEDEEKLIDDRINDLILEENSTTIGGDKHIINEDYRNSKEKHEESLQSNQIWKIMGLKTEDKDEIEQKKATAHWNTITIQPLEVIEKNHIEANNTKRKLEIKGTNHGHRNSTTNNTHKRPNYVQKRNRTLRKRSSTKEINITDDNNTHLTVDINKIDETVLFNDYDEVENISLTSDDDMGNCTNSYCMSEDDYYTLIYDYIIPTYYEWILIGAHSVVFFIGLIGNTLVCVAVYRNHSMRTVTNYFIVNLAVADFMVILFCLPPSVIWDVTETWFMGTVMCKVVVYVQTVSVTVSVLTLTFISIDRWYAICFPLKFKSTTSRAKTAILIIWMLALSFDIPELVVLTTVKRVPYRQMVYFTQCTAAWSDDSETKWNFTKMILLYAFPLLFMSFAYSQIIRVLWKTDQMLRAPYQTRNVEAGLDDGDESVDGSEVRRGFERGGMRMSGKILNFKAGMSGSKRGAFTTNLNATTDLQLRSRRKAAKMLVAVVIMFAVCYFPVHLLSILRFLVEIPQTDFYTALALITHWLCYANSAINPVIYNFMSGKFRKEFYNTFGCVICFKPRTFERGRDTIVTRSSTYKCRTGNITRSEVLPLTNMPSSRRKNSSFTTTITNYN